MDKKIQIKIEALLKTGLNLDAIAKALELRDNEINSMTKKYDNGSVEHFLKYDQMVCEGKIPVPLYIYWSKTKWARFFPQEKKQVDNDVEPIDSIEVDLIDNTKVIENGD